VFTLALWKEDLQEALPNAEMCAASAILQTGIK
jgi:hypothetical protein